MMRVLFVSNELYPFDKGGIGRFLYNYAAWNSRQADPVEMHVLYTRENAFASKWNDEDDVALKVHVPVKGGGLSGRQVNVVAASDHLQKLIDDSVEIADQILNLLDRVDFSFDYIEFPDFGAWGLCTIRRKLAGDARLRSTRIVVRLHSSMTAIQADEGTHHKPSEWFAAMTDAERYCLARADLVVGHIGSIIGANQALFGFGAEWKKRTYREFPPVELSSAEKRVPNLRVNGDKTAQHSSTFVFSSRFQPFKRPELFIDAAVHCVTHHPESRDRFVLSSYGWNHKYIEKLENLIPKAFSSRIEIRLDQSFEERLDLLNTGTVVISSSYESFCIFAHECYLLGRKIILNARCKAFGENPFWKDGQNCLFFDGTGVGLAQVMEASKSFTPPARRRLPSTVPYWRRADRPATVRSCEESPAVELLVAGEAEQLPQLTECANRFLATGKVKHAHLVILGQGGGRHGAAGTGITAHQVSSSRLGDASLTAIVQECEAQHLLIVEPFCRPTTLWQEGIEVALAVSRDGTLAFALAENDDDGEGGKWHLPAYDCPNLMAAGYGLSQFPLMVCRETVLELLKHRSEPDCAIEYLILDLCLSGSGLDVIHLPVVRAKSAGPSTTFSRRMLAHSRAKILRQHAPHLAAYNIENHQPQAFPQQVQKELRTWRNMLGRTFTKIERLFRK